MKQNEFNIDELVQRRLDDIADQCEFLIDQKEYKTAEFLRQRGLEFAKFADAEGNFFYADDLTHTLGA
jgi:hypothetical protein